MGDELRSLDARVAKLAKAVAKTCDAQLQSVETVNRMTSDIASLMADVRELGRRYEHMAVAVHRLTGLLDGREEMKSTSAYPVASGAYDDDLARMASAGSGYRQMADYIGCDESVVARRCRLIGIESPLARKKWTRREDDVLRQAAMTATTWEEVASELPLRSEGACKSRAKYLGVSLYKRSRIWSDEDDDFMREHWTGVRHGRPRDRAPARAHGGGGKVARPSARSGGWDEEKPEPPVARTSGSGMHAR